MFKNNITKQEVSEVLKKFKANLKTVTFKKDDSGYTITNSQGEELTIPKSAESISLESSVLKSKNLKDAIEEILQTSDKHAVFGTGFEKKEGVIELGGVFDKDIVFDSETSFVLFNSDVELNGQTTIDSAWISELKAGETVIDKLELNINDGYLFASKGKIESRKSINFFAGNGITEKDGTYLLDGKLDKDIVFEGGNVTFKSPEFKLRNNKVDIMGDLSVKSQEKISLDAPNVRLLIDDVINGSGYDTKVLGIANEYGDITLRPMYSPIAIDESGEHANAASTKVKLTPTDVEILSLNTNTFSAKFATIREANLSGQGFSTDIKNWTGKENDIWYSRNIDKDKLIFKVESKDAHSDIDISPETISICAKTIKFPKQENGFLTIEDKKLKVVNTQVFSLPIAFNTNNYGGTVPSYLIFEDTDITSLDKISLEEGTYKLYGTFGFTDEVVLTIVDENNKSYFKQEGKTVHLNNYVTYLPKGIYKISIVSNQPSVYLKNQTNFITIEK